MKKRFSEEQIIGFLRETDAGMPVKDLCRRVKRTLPNGTTLRRTILPISKIKKG